MINFEEALRKAVKDYSKWAMEFAEAKPTADYLDRMVKTVLSEEMLKQDPKLSLGEKEARARVSEPLRLHFKGLQEAEHKAAMALARREAAYATWESLRSLCSYEKKHMDTFEHEPEHEV